MTSQAFSASANVLTGNPPTLMAGRIRVRRMETLGTFVRAFRF